jgi:hypothetical protein
LDNAAKCGVDGVTLDVLEVSIDSKGFSRPDLLVRIALALPGLELPASLRLIKASRRKYS